MKCEHIKSELRYMEHCKQYRYQCLNCFQSSGDAIAKAKINPEYLLQIKPFDLQARDQFWKSQDEARTNNASAIANAAIEKLAKRRSFYNEYMQSFEWREKRKLVIMREGGICQGCRLRSIEQVHHRNYDRLGDELLTDLYGYCEACHQKAHNLL